MSTCAGWLCFFTFPGESVYIVGNAHNTMREGTMKTNLGFAAVLLGAVAMALNAGGATFDVRDFGARPDGQTLNTEVLQFVIDICSRGGGGVVRLEGGAYLTGTLYLKNGVILEVAQGATLLGSDRLEDYPERRAEYASYTDNYTNKALVYAESAQDIGLRGEGTIDGQGASFKGDYLRRPFLVRFVKCQGVITENITLQNSPMWVYHVLACDDVRITGVTIRSKVNRNNDGLDIDCCRNVRVSGCDIWSGDDAIVLKSTSGRVCERVTVTNCVLNSDCNGLKMGTESNGGFKHITISNCVLYKVGISGIALEMVDGGVMDGVAISNIRMTQCNGAIFMRLGNRARVFREGMPKPGVGEMRNISISNVVATDANDIGCAISGLPGHRIENLALENIRIQFAGGGKKAWTSLDVPENEAEYPEYTMFGELPAYGFYVRHVKGIRMRGVAVSAKRPDARPALVCDDVADLDLFDFQGAPYADQPAVVRLHNVRRALVQGCRALPGTGTWLAATGEATADIDVRGCALGQAAQAMAPGETSPPDAVRLAP